MPVGNAVAVEVPETQFTRVGGDRIAYQVLGDGPPDLLVAASTDAMDLRWDWPPYAHFLRRLASFSRVILFDRRGSAASDPVSREGASVWEDWADEQPAAAAARPACSRPLGAPHGFSECPITRCGASPPSNCS